MADLPDDRPRTWVPLVAAGAVGAVVVGGAIAAFALGGGPGETEAAVIAACEAEHESEGGAPVVAGEVFDPTEWRDHYAAVEASGDDVTPLAEVAEEVVEQWESSAESFREDGAGTWVIIWRLDDDSHAQCMVPVVGTTVDAAQAAVGPPAPPPVNARG